MLPQFVQAHASQLITGAWIAAYFLVCVAMTRSERRLVQFAGWFFAGMLAGILILSAAAVVYGALTTGGAA